MAVSSVCFSRDFGPKAAHRFNESLGLCQERAMAGALEYLHPLALRRLDAFEPVPHQRNRYIHFARAGMMASAANARLAMPLPVSGTR